MPLTELKKIELKETELKAAALQETALKEAALPDPVDPFDQRQPRRRLRFWWMLGAVSGSLTVALTGAFLGLEAKAQTRLPARDPQQVPTARYGRGESVDLSLIVEEWRDRYPAIPVYTCSCNADTCGDESVWPFRSFTRYQPFLALGAFNAANNEDNGFNCFDIETGDRP